MWRKAVARTLTPLTPPLPFLHPTAGNHPQAPRARDGGTGHPPTLPQAGIAGDRGRPAAPGHGGESGGIEFGMHLQKEIQRRTHGHGWLIKLTPTHALIHTKSGVGPGRADDPAAPPLRPVRTSAFVACPYRWVRASDSRSNAHIHTRLIPLSTPIPSSPNPHTSAYRMENALPSSSSSSSDSSSSSCPSSPFVDVPAAVEAWKGGGGYATCVLESLCVRGRVPCSCTHSLPG